MGSSDRWSTGSDYQELRRNFENDEDYSELEINNISNTRKTPERPTSREHYQNTIIQHAEQD